MYLTRLSVRTGAGSSPLEGLPALEGSDSDYSSEGGAMAFTLTLRYVSDTAFGV